MGKQPQQEDPLWGRGLEGGGVNKLQPRTTIGGALVKFEYIRFLLNLPASSLTKGAVVEIHFSESIHLNPFTKYSYCSLLHPSDSWVQQRTVGIFAVAPKSTM